MRKHRYPKSHPEAQENPMLEKFRQQIEIGVYRGETLDQLAERIDQENTPDFYGAEFRKAYSEGLASSSAYGYEQPLDLHDVVKHSFEHLMSFPQRVECFKCSEEVTEEAEFEVIENTLPMVLTMDFNNSEAVSFSARVEECGVCWGGGKIDIDEDTRTINCWACGGSGGKALEVNEQPGEELCKNASIENTEGCEFLPLKRCPAELAVEDYFGIKDAKETTPVNTDFGQLVGLLYHFKENYLDKEDPGKDLIITPLGEMTFKEWDLYLSSLPAEERKQFEAPKD